MHRRLESVVRALILFHGLWHPHINVAHRKFGIEVRRALRVGTAATLKECLVLIECQSLHP